MHNKKNKLRQAKLPIKYEVIRELSSQSLTQVAGGQTPTSASSISNCPECP
jgi:hypothetical protein